MFISYTRPQPPPQPLLPLLLLLIILIVNFTAGANALRCAYLKLESSTEDSSDLRSISSAADSGAAVQTDETRSVLCGTEGSYCFALWHSVDPKQHTTTTFPSTTHSHRLIAAGCWNNTQDTFCSQSQCLALRKPPKALNDTKFCCCSGNLCNSKLSSGVSDAPIVVDTIEENYQQSRLNLELESVNIFQEIVRHPLLLFVLIFTLFILTVILVFTICYKSILSSSSNLLKHGKATDSLHLLESQSLQPASQHHFSSAPRSSSSSSSSSFFSFSSSATSIASMSPNTLLEELSFEELVGRGKYGHVWRGTLQSGSSGSATTVAIKVVSEQNKRYLVNECRIYSLHRSFAEESTMARYYGYCERLSEDGRREYCMAMEYGQHGSLHAYLQQHTLDWTGLCRLLRSLAQAVAYLHTEQTVQATATASATGGQLESGSKGGKLVQKPSIVHRDLCSRNVIVKADGSCMIVDYQFAVPFLNNKPLFLESQFAAGGHHRGSSSSSGRHCVVGTLRYLAPELLDGAINLNHAESALKQADIYALGLIFWEVASRCTDLYQGIDVPPYQAPFELETGGQELQQHLTFDQMRVLVSRNKARPLFPDIWKDSNPAIRLLKETISECWDQEPEARLTALCIKERLSDLHSLWRKFKSEMASCCVVSSLQQLKSIQNTLNGQSGSSGLSTVTGSCTGHGGHCSATGHHHQTLKSSNSSIVLNECLESAYPLSTCYINKFENSLHYKHNGHHHLLHHPYHKHHFYQINLTASAGSSAGGSAGSINTKKMDLNSTVEKNMQASLSASASARSSPNGEQMQLSKLTLPLQPHQARNLCIERNLMSDTSDEYDGLLEQGLKFQRKSYIKSNISTDEEEGGHQRGDNGEEQAAGGSDGHRHHHHHHHPHYPENRTPLIRPPLPLPISYVQNETSSQSVKTKETNKLQNRNVLHCGQMSSSSKVGSASLSLFDYIKQKLNLASHLNKSMREKLANKHNSVVTPPAVTAASIKQSSSGGDAGSGAAAANSSGVGLLEEWKENVEPDEDLEIAAVRIGTLLYAKDRASLEYSNQSVNVRSQASATAATLLLPGTVGASGQSTSYHQPPNSVTPSGSGVVDNSSSNNNNNNNNSGHLLSQAPSASNSSALISAPECDLPTTLDILSNMDKLAQLTTTTVISSSIAGGNPNPNPYHSSSSSLSNNPNNNNNSCIQNNNRIDSLSSIFLGGKALLAATSEIVVDEPQLLH